MQTVYPLARDKFLGGYLQWRASGGHSFRVAALDSTYAYSEADEFRADLTGVLGTAALTGLVAGPNGWADAADVTVTGMRCPAPRCNAPARRRVQERPQTHRSIGSEPYQRGRTSLTTLPLRALCGGVGRVAGGVRGRRRTFFAHASSPPKSRVRQQQPRRGNNLPSRCTAYTLTGPP